MQREREREREKEIETILAIVKSCGHILLQKNNTNKMSINNIKRPKQWLSLLQYDRKNQTDAERRTIVMNRLEHWSEKNFFLSADPRPK